MYDKIINIWMIVVPLIYLLTWRWKLDKSYYYWCHAGLLGLILQFICIALTPNPEPIHVPCHTCVARKKVKPQPIVPRDINHTPKLEETKVTKEKTQVTITPISTPEGYIPKVGEHWFMPTDDPWGEPSIHRVEELKQGWVRWVMLHDKDEYGTPWTDRIEYFTEHRKKCKIKF